MREIALVAAGVIAGGFTGVTFMCLFQINKDRHYIITRKDGTENEEKKHSEDCQVQQRRSTGFAEEGKKACLSEAGLIRLLLRGYEPREKPDERFYDVMRELSSIGNNINQLAVKANALGFVDAPQLKKEAERWHKFQADIERTYLRPDKSEMKWQ